MSNFKNLQVTDALSVQVMPDKDHVFVMSTNEVAHGYDCGTSAIRECLRRNQEEFEEGKHFFSSVTNRDSGNLQTKTTFWTKRGIVRLGFFLKTGRAKLFRDWAEDLIINGGSSRTNLREDEVEMLALIHANLLPGDQRIIAGALGVSPRTVSSVKCGRSRSGRILNALIEKAASNKKHGRQLVIGYSPDFVSMAINKLNL